MVNGSGRMHKQILLYFFFTCRLIGNYFLFRTPMSKSILPYRNLLDDPVPSPTDWAHLPVVAISTITDIAHPTQPRGYIEPPSFNK